MRYFYRCAVCQSGFWYDMAIENNNLECLNCGSHGHEMHYDEGMKREVPKLHRIQVERGAKGGLELPGYSYECEKCEHVSVYYRGMKDVNQSKCRKCKAGPEHLKQVWPSAPYVISDVSHQEGRTGEDLAMPIFGKNVRVASRRQIKEYKRLTRDKYWADTDRTHSVLKPFKDPETGKITMEKVTRKGRGIDLGEIHEIESPDPPKVDKKKEEREWQKLEQKAAAQVEVAD